MDEHRQPEEFTKLPEEYVIPEEYPSGIRHPKTKKRGVNPMLMFVFAGFLVLMMGFGFLFSNDSKENDEGLGLDFFFPSGDEGEKEDDTLSDFEEELRACLEDLGISEEEFADMTAEEQNELLAQMGLLGMQGGSQMESTEATKAARYTTADVMAGGSYLVQIGDLWYNNYYLYYVDAQLVKAEGSFRKNDEEPEEYYLWEGDTLTDFWYYDMTLDEMIAYFDEQNYGYSVWIKKLDE